MASANAFTPNGPTVLVAASAVQISAIGSNSYRVRNLSASAQYFTHGAASSVTSVGAPTAGVPSQNTIGMLGSSVETFSNLLPWMIASSATGFEVTAGDGV
jgi:hypothetical protein